MTTNTPAPGTAETTSTTAPVPGSKEHDAALAATFETRDANAGQPTPAAEPTPERPSNVPEKFWDADKGEVKWDAIAALDTPAKEGEAKPDEKPEDKPSTGFETVTAEGTKALADVGLDYAKYAESYQKNGGKLTDADYAEMAEKNIPKAVVDAHIKGLMAAGEAEAAVFRSSIFEVVGGEAKYGELVAWAKTNVPAADIAAFDKVVDSGSVDAVKLAVQGLQSRMTAANGVEPKLINGGSGSASLDVFESTAQLTDAMKDPRYARDPAYRNAIMAKLGRSNIM